MKALLTATFSFSLKSQVFLFFLWQLFLTECHAEYQVVKKKKMCACFPGQGIKGPREERKSFCGKTLDTLNVLHLPKLELLFFLSDFTFGYFEHKTFRAKTQCLPPAVILLCWWEKSETETRKPCVRKKKSLKTPRKDFSCLFYVCKIICHLCYFRAAVTMTYPFPFSCPSDLHLILSTFPLGNLEENKHST